MSLAVSFRSVTVRPTQATRRSVAVRAQPAQQVKTLTSAEAIKTAEETCREGSQKECAAAWDLVEKVAADEEFTARKRLAMMRRASELACASKAALDKLMENDPLERFCAESPDADECRVYED